MASDTELPVTQDHFKYTADKCPAVMLGFIDNGAFNKTGQIKAGEEAAIVLDKTCFYAEMGGQVGDVGIIESDKGKFVVDATTKVADCVIHKGKLLEGTIAVGDKVTALVSPDRDATKKNHTATHLLQWALRQILGTSVAQQGSLVCPDYLRFDFTYPKSLDAEQTKQVESLVRDKIAADLPVTCAVLSRETRPTNSAQWRYSAKNTATKSALSRSVRRTQMASTRHSARNFAAALTLTGRAL